MQNNDNNSRRNFLKKLPLALGSIVVLSSFSLKKSDNVSYQKFKTLSKKESDEIIKNNNFPSFMKVKPSPAPVGQITLK